MPESAIVITTTSNQLLVLEKIARMLVEKKLAACVQVGSTITSFFYWDGKLDQSEEYQCQIKTVESKFGEIEQLIRAHHNYDLPEVIAVKLHSVSADYLEWIHRETNTSTRA